MPVGYRELPNPADLLLGGRPFMLATGPGGAPRYRQSRIPLAQNVVTPMSRTFGLASPRLETPRGFFAFTYGMGFQEEDPDATVDTPGYQFGRFVAVADGKLLNGPAVTTVTPSTTDATAGV